MMPGWLRIVAHANPLTYQVDVLRGLMLAGGANTFGLPVDFAVLAATAAILVAVAAWLYPSIVR